MEGFKNTVDFDIFNPVHGGDSEEEKTITFKVSDFNSLITAVKYGVISEINEGKKTISNDVVEKMFKYLDGEATEEDVLASLKEHKKSYRIPEKNFSANWETGEASLYGIEFNICGTSPSESGFIPLQEIADELSVDIGVINSLLMKYKILDDSGGMIGDGNPEDFIGPGGKTITEVDPAGFILVNVAKESDTENVYLCGSRDFIKGLVALDRKSTE